ncbi:MAG: peptidylprolyl isomerase [Candidatus Cloacimonetes bacterium]|nr:peptidylprolyl isomerase [Candidatus Cloacimonadota bacterium]MCB5255622.1 peptidylprolyl isomerase [Candidatus Cloacimonadota bacterium]MCK9179205.1 peptidylprolyl isomerase [Candidatus Cloacimonadota bacterium]MCK9242946.1 peptidylprolyl isomerase [Candidatus Cloacimonadota bacterium]MDD3104316.1 peptidylprolyl isomerase [Candidatus Cloacimonadota bacterium]
MKKDLLYILLLALMLSFCAQVAAKAQIGDRAYSEAELTEGFTAYLEYRGIEAELSPADSLTLYQNYFDELIAMYIYDRAMQEYGVHVSPKELDDEIKANPPQGVRQIPDLMTDGHFDQKKYEHALRENPQFKQDIMTYSRDVYGYNKLLNSIRAEARIDTLKIKRDWLALSHQADAEIIYFDYNSLQDITVTDSEVRKYYEEIKQEYRREDGRSLFFIRFASGSERENIHRLDEIKAQREQLYQSAQNLGLKAAAAQLGLPVKESQFFSATDDIIRGIGRVPDLVRQSFDNSPGTLLEPYHTPMKDVFICEVAQSVDEYYIPFEVESALLKLRLRSLKRQAAMQDIAQNFIRKHKSKNYLKAAKEEGYTVIHAEDVKRDSMIKNLGTIVPLNRAILTTAEGEITPLIEHNGFYYLAKVLAHQRFSEEDWLLHKEDILSQALQAAQEQYLDEWYLQQKAEIEIQYPQGL